MCRKGRFAERKYVESPLMILLMKTIEYEIRNINPRNRSNKNCTTKTVRSCRLFMYRNTFRKPTNSIVRNPTARVIRKSQRKINSPSERHQIVIHRVEIKPIEIVGSRLRLCGAESLSTDFLSCKAHENIFQSRIRK